MTVSTTLDLSAASAVLKEMYSGQKVEDVTYTSNPFFALLTKGSDFRGKVYPVPVQTSPSAGGGSDFASAYANQAAPDTEAFLVTRGKRFALGTIDRETMMAGASGDGAFIKTAQLCIDGALQNCTNMICADLFGAGDGVIGEILGTVTSGVIHLKDPSTVVRFEKHQKLVAVASSTPRTAAGFVVSVDRVAGTVTVSTTLSGSPGTPTDWATTDSLALAGDYGTKYPLTGLAGWLPFTKPAVGGGDNFFGVDRSSDPTRLSGVYLDGSDRPIEDALIDLAVMLVREGGRPNVVIMSPTSFGNFAKSLSGRIVYVNVGDKAEWAFEAIAINIPGVGPAKIIADRNCTGQLAYMLTMSTWELKGLGAVPEIQPMGGPNGDFLTLQSADQSQIRVSAYANLICYRPGHNGVVKLSA